MKLVIVAALGVFLVAIPAGAGGYSRYGNYYQPSYYAPTYSYYPQAYSTYNYMQPQYSYMQPIDYYNGQYYYHSSGYDSAGRFYPAGNYAWINNNWYQNGSPYYATTSREAKALKQEVNFQPGWQKQLLEIAGARDKVEGRLRQNAQDFQAYLKALEALGLQGNFRIQNYGQSIPLAPYASPGYPTPYSSSRLGQFGANGNTLYGYNYSTIKEIYGDSSPAVYMQQQAKLAEGLQQLADKGDQRYAENVARDGNNRARVAEILAYGQSRKMALDSSHPQIPYEERTEERRNDQIETEGQGQGQIQQGGRGHGQNQGQAQSIQEGRARVTMPRADDPWVQFKTERCGSCHGGEKKEGGFEVAKYESLSPELKQRVWARLTTTDKDKMMPRSKDGGPGKRLTADEFKQFVLH